MVIAGLTLYIVLKRLTFVRNELTPLFGRRTHIVVFSAPEGVRVPLESRVRFRPFVPLTPLMGGVFLCSGTVMPCQLGQGAGWDQVISF